MKRQVLAFAIVLMACAGLVPRVSHACGGFFCSATPIDQTAERIIFAKDGHDIVSWVQISYAGAAEDFAWVVPVGSVPSVEVADPAIFSALDSITAPQLGFPPCVRIGPQLGGAPSPTSHSAVTVFRSGDVGPYHFEVVGSEDADMLINWLNDNRYIITPQMEPMVAHYVEEDLLFLAMKLQSDEDVDSIAPVRLTYEGTNPVVPIRLTAVAAEPDLGLIVWILGDHRAVTANFVNAELDTSLLRFDGFRTNYNTAVARTIDAHGGQAFITEFAGPSSGLLSLSTNDELTALLETYDYVSRLYTTISPEEMTSDPLFVFNPGLPDVTRNMTFENSEEWCSGTTPCDRTSCGAGASCYEINGAAACDCPEGFNARGVTGGLGGRGTIACVPEDGELFEDEPEFSEEPAPEEPDEPNNPEDPDEVLPEDPEDPAEGLPEDPEEGMPSGPNPCASTTCGEFGECVALNGDATCACDDGYGGQEGPDGGVRCVELAAGVLVYDPALNVDPETGGFVPYGSLRNSRDGSLSEPEQLAEERGNGLEGEPETGCSTMERRRAGWGIVLIGLLFGARRGRTGVERP